MAASGGDQPVLLHEYAECGEGMSRFAEINEQAVLLAYLRHKRYGEAARLSLSGIVPGDLRDRLLTTLGFNPLKVLAGAWLSSKYGNLEKLCEGGSDYGARLTLRWAELHWDDAVESRKRHGYVPVGKEPEIPGLEL